MCTCQSNTQCAVSTVTELNSELGIVHEHVVKNGTPELVHHLAAAAAAAECSIPPFDCICHWYGFCHY